MEIIICDLCDTREGVKRVPFPVGSQLDGVGGSETISKIIDFCDTCRLKITLAVIEDEYKNINRKWDFNKLVVAAFNKAKGRRG